MPENPPRYRIIFRALASAVPVEVRLRRVLKYALRVAGLRVEKVELLPPTDKGGKDRA